MNIEDVKQIDDAQLDRLIFSVTNSYALSNGWDEYHKQYGFIPCYSKYIEAAREAQEKAMSKDFELYIYNLGKVLHIPDERFVQVDLGYTSGIQHIYIGAVAHMLQATPRQICEASYITLQEAQG